MGEKGSIKNLYKEWRLFLKKKKAKKEKEEVNAQKKNNSIKMKAFFAAFFAILMAPVGVSLYSSKKPKKDIKVIISELDNIKKEIDKDLKVKELQVVQEKLSICSDVVKDIRANDRKVSKKEVELATLEISKLSDKVSDRLIDEYQKPHSIEDGAKEETIVIINKSGLTSKKIKVKSSEDQISEEKEDIVVSGKKMVNTANKRQRIIGRKKVGIGLNENVVLFLTISNLEIEELTRRLRENLTLDQLSEISKRITELANKRISVRSRYDLSDVVDIYEEKDKYKLLKNTEKIDELYDICKKKISGLEVAEIEKKDKKKENKIEIDYREINLLKKSISMDIAKQREKVNSVKKALQSVSGKNRKVSLLTGVKNMVTNTLFLCLGLVPFVVFKNKLIGGLLSAFMINNSIRSIRSVVVEREIAYLELHHLGVIVNNRKDCVKNTRIVYEDATMQVSSLKQELLSKYNASEIADVLGQLDNIEDEIRSKKAVLMNLEDELDYEYNKSKQKIKKMAA